MCSMSFDKTFSLSLNEVITNKILCSFIVFIISVLELFLLRKINLSLNSFIKGIC